MKYITAVFITIIVIMTLVLYVNNGNNTLLGITNDSFWINWFIVFYVYLNHKLGIVSYNDINTCGYSKTLYRLIGVKFVKRILVINPIPISIARLSLKDNSIESIKILEKQMRVAEAVHGRSFVLSIIIMLFLGFMRDMRFVYLMMVFNIIINLYPCFVQRYNRNRIATIVELMKSKK